MAEKFSVTSKNNHEIFKDTAKVGEAKRYQINLAQWAEENTAITGTPTWEVSSGQAAISGAAITDSVASALVTFSEPGGNLLKITATGSGGEKFVALIDVLARDRVNAGADDYGLTS